MLKVLVLVLVVVVVAYAQIPHHCIVHPELSFRAFQFNHNLTTFRDFNAEYDGRQQRIAFVEKERQGVGVQRVWVIMLYNERQGYEINLKTRKCVRFMLRRPFSPFGVPPDATFEAEFYIGGPGEDVNAVDWSDKFHDNTTDITWRGVFSSMNCYPIRFFEKNDQNNHSLTTNIYDLTEGIVDPSAFIPPQECQQGAALTTQPSNIVRDIQGIFRL